MMQDATTQTDDASPAPPSYHQIVTSPDAFRLQRFLIHCMTREYNADTADAQLSFSEMMQWNDVGRDPPYQASRDRAKFDKRIDEYIENPSKELNVPARKVWIYATGHGKNFLRNSSFRQYVRETAMREPQSWATKLCEDRVLLETIITETKEMKLLGVKIAIGKAIEKEISIWFVNLVSDTEWKLTPKGEMQWAWRRHWM